MIFDLEGKSSTILKVFGYITLVWLFFIVHITIHLLAHSAIVAIKSGISIDEAITPLHSSIMENDFIGAYHIIRKTTFSELPFYSYINGLFGEKASLSLADIFFDLVKVGVSELICYLLCRFNHLLSSKKNHFLFAVITSFWINISIYSSLVFITWIRKFPAHISNIIILGISFLIFASLALSLISFISLRNQNINIPFKRIWGKHLTDFLSSALDSLVTYLVSCFSFDILHRYISDDLTLIMTTIFAGLLFRLIYSFIKVKVIE